MMMMAGPSSAAIGWQRMASDWSFGVSHCRSVIALVCGRGVSHTDEAFLRKTIFFYKTVFTHKEFLLQVQNFYRWSHFFYSYIASVQTHKSLLISTKPFYGWTTPLQQTWLYTDSLPLGTSLQKQWIVPPCGCIRNQPLAWNYSFDTQYQGIGRCLKTRYQAINEKVWRVTETCYRVGCRIGG